MAWHGGDHGVGVDQVTVRQEREEERKKGTMGSHGLLMLPFTSAGTKVELAGR